MGLGRRANHPRGTQGPRHPALQEPLLHGRVPRTLAPFAGIGELPHIKKLDDAVGHFLVRITCKCGAQRIAEPDVLARLCGRNATLEAVSRRMRCPNCGTRGAEVVAVSVPRLGGNGFNR